MDPINKKMKIKKVAGFHPFCTLNFFLHLEGDRDRKGFGTRDFQKETSATELTARAWRASASGLWNKPCCRKDGARSPR